MLYCQNIGYYCTFFTLSVVHKTEETPSWLYQGNTVVSKLLDFQGQPGDWYCETGDRLKERDLGKDLSPLIWR